MKVFNAISSHCSGTVVEICFDNGADVDEDDVLIRVQ